eukprot:scaffold351361_cov32-Prasinocladus_malaysianus.AAC.1
MTFPCKLSPDNHSMCTLCVRQAAKQAEQCRSPWLDGGVGHGIFESLSTLRTPPETTAMPSLQPLDYDNKNRCPSCELYCLRSITQHKPKYK